MASTVLSDARWIARGEERTSLPRFLLWLAPWAALLAVGVYAAWLCLYYGLNQTNMDNRFAFGLWIFLDLGVIALGAGAFFTGFLVYILKRDELKPVLNTAVVVGFICYSGAVAILMIDVGQPLRAWFTFWHPNTHSMLTEVTFCISCYLLVLSLEYIPLLLRNRQLRKLPSFLVFEHQLHKLVPVLAAVGTLLSFFHQGSLGGLYGVLRGRPFAFRAGFLIWPSTFFLFILSAIASGPSLLMLVTATVEKVTGRKLVPQELFRRLGFISGVLLAIYIAAKSIDTLVWLNVTSPSVGFAPWQYYSYKPFGIPILFAEIVLFGLLPAFLLLFRKTSAHRGWLLAAAAMTCIGVLLNRFVLTIQTLALPTLPFDDFVKYTPSWQEVASFAGVIAYGVILYSLSYRYLPLFAPVKGEESQFPGIDGFHWTFGHIIFLGLFFAVAVTIAVTVARAAWQTARDFRTHHAMDLCWHAEFEELPVAERRCRHELAGRVISRTCDNAFNCRSCQKYSHFAVLPATGNVGASGLNYSDDVYYHRGHTWVKPADDGTVVIGLDDLAQHIVGTPDSVKMPQIGEPIDLNQTAWRMKKNGKQIKVRAPLEGTVAEIGGPDAGWYLKLRPRLDIRDPRTLRHLLRGPEVRGWIARGVDRMQLQLRAPQTPAALADGGIMLPDLMNAVPDADWDTVLADTFLEA